MPDVNEAFAASFRFVTTGAATSPVAQRGLTPPANWGAGLRSSGFAWGTLSPDGNGWGWGVSADDPLYIYAATNSAGEFRANGNPFTVNVVGYSSTSVLTNAEVQVSAFTTADDTPNGTPTYIDAPFAGFLWGLWTPGARLSPIPARNGGMTTFSNAGPLPLSLSAGRDEYGVPIFQCPLITFLFANNLRGLVATRGKIFIDVAIYLSLDNVKCYDDPEMEIDLGSS